MTTAKSLRDVRRRLRAAEDDIEDVIDLLGQTDREQTRRLRAVIREIQSEIAEVDRKISAAERNGSAK
jgi:DNA-nicking Smr family endonuclease